MNHWALGTIAVCNSLKRRKSNTLFLPKREMMWYREAFLVVFVGFRWFVFWFFFLRKFFAGFGGLGCYRTKKTGLLPSVSTAFLLVYLF